MSDGDFVKACLKSRIPAGRPVVLSLLGKKVGIFMRDDEVYALEMSCKHQGADLSKGRMEGHKVTCQRHGWQYDLLSGECLEPPDGAALRFFDVKVDGNQVWVSIRPRSL